jgi:sec-independent protein translocase protein TatA
MGSFSIWHWLLVIVVVLLLFGRGKISDLMGDVAKGIKSFKKGMADDPEEVAKQEAKALEQQAADAAARETAEKAKS